MDEADSVELQDGLDRLRDGDREARRLAGRMMHGSFPDLARRHEVDSIVHEGGTEARA